MYGWKDIRASLLEAIYTLSTVEDIAKVESALQALVRMYEMLDLEDINMRKDLAFVLLTSGNVHRMPTFGKKMLASENWPDDWRSNKGRHTLHLWLKGRRNMTTRRLLRLVCLRLWRFYQRERMLRELLFYLEEDWDALNEYSKALIFKIRDFNGKYPEAIGVYPKDKWRRPAALRELMEGCKHAENLQVADTDRERNRYNEVARRIEERAKELRGD